MHADCKNIRYNLYNWRGETIVIETHISSYPSSLELQILVTEDDISVVDQELSSSPLKLLRQNNPIFSENDELYNYILKLLKKMGEKLYCNCQYRLIEEVPFLTYKLINLLLACHLNRCYPETWDRDKKVGADWTKKFIECYMKF